MTPAAAPNDDAPLAAPHVAHERVRWSDVDKMAIIRYDAYVRFFELGEMELFRAAGFPFRVFAERADVTFPRRVLHQDYVSPCVLDELLEVRTRVSRLGTTSLTLAYDIRGDGGAVRATGYMVLVCVDPASFRTRPIPDDLRAGLARFLIEDEAAAEDAPPTPPSAPPRDTAATPSPHR
jgi:acyl-CoA thioester hydrolase